MAQAYKVLGQQAPSATTETALYTVPASTSAVVSTLVVCNRDSSSGTFRVSVDVGGSGTANKDYLFYDSTLSANETMTATLGITLATTDIVYVYASSANFSFNLFGTEIT